MKLQERLFVGIAVFALIAACACVGRGDPPPKAPAQHEPAEVLAAINRCGMAKFDDAGRICWLMISKPGAADSSLSFLRRLDGLRELQVDNAEGNPNWVASISGLAQLETLATYRGGLNDELLRHLAGLKRLRKLSIHVSGVTDAGFGYLLPLTSLEELSIVDALVTNANLKLLAQLPRLKRLTLVNTRVTPEGVLLLRDTRLEAYSWFDDQREYKEVLPYIKQLKHIRVAGGSQSGIIDDDLENFAGMTSVEELNLSGNWITDAGLRHLERLTNLRSLDLGDQREGRPRITDTGVSHLSGLTELRRLELRGSLVTTAGLEKLRGLTKLQYLGITNTPLKDAKVLDLRHFHHLRHVDAYGGDDSQWRVPEGCTVETFD